MSNVVHQHWVQGQASIDLVVDTCDPLTPDQLSHIEVLVANIEVLLTKLNAKAGGS